MDRSSSPVSYDWPEKSFDLTTLNALVHITLLAVRLFSLLKIRLVLISADAIAMAKHDIMFRSPLFIADSTLAACVLGFRVQ